jgi:hypothetical protein
MKISREQILLSLQRALLCEVYPSIRAVVYKHLSENGQFKLRYYLDRTPTDDDYESIGNVMAEFISDFKYSDFEDLVEECLYSKKPLSELDILDGIVYCRMENK